MFLSTLRRNIAWNVLCVLIVLAGFLGSSASGALKTANWIGGGVAGSYNDPANWDIPVVPINGADDYIVNIAAGVTVNFDVPATGHQIFQFTLPSTSTFVVDSGRDIEVTDAAAISGIVNTTNGQLLAGHASSSFGGSTSRVTVAGGGDITAGGASYSCAGLNGFYTIFSADSISSTLNFPQLTSIDAARSSGTDLVYTVKASNDGAIDMPALTSISGPTYEAHDRIEFIVESGGTINMNNLATTTSGNGKVRFDIRDAPGGVFSLPALQTSNDAEFILATGLTANLGTAGTPAAQNGGSFTLGDGAIVNYTPLTTLQWATINLGINSEFHAPDLLDIGGSIVTLAPGRTLETGVIGWLDNARIAVTGGSQWGVAQGDLSATSYACTDLNGVYTIFSASDGSSVLDLSTLTSIDASLYSGTNLVYTVRASNSGAIDLSALTNVSGPTYEAHDRIEFIVESGGTIDLSNLATTTSGNGKVRFDVRDTSGGAFSLPALQTSDDAEFIVAAGLTVNLGAAGNPATQSGGSFTLGAGAEVYYTPLTTLEWSTINLGGGSLFHAPNLVDIDGTSWTLSPGGVLSTGEISSLDNARLTVTGGTQWGVAQGNLSATSYSCADLIGQYTIFSATDTGSALDLSTLTSIDASLYSGTDLVYTVRASNNGAIDLSVLASVSGPTYEAHDRIEFIVESGGTIDLSSLMTTTSGVGKVRFDIRDTSGGPFSLPALQTSDDMEVIVAAGGLTVNLGTAGTPATQSGGSFTLGDSAVVNYTPLTTLEWSTISLGVGSEFHAPNLVDIDGTTVTLSPGRTFETGVIGSLDNARLAVTGGVEWGVAQGNLSATSYSCAGLDGQYTIFSATDAGSVLDLSTLTAIAADRWTGTNLVYSVRASDNGTVDLSGVTSVSVPTYETIDRIEFIATTGGTIDLSSLQTVTGGVGEARFTASAGGTMRFGELLLTDALNLSVADGASKVVVGGGLHLDPTSDLSITGGATVQIAGDFSYDYTSDSKLNADTGILQFHTAGDHQLEVGGLDLGVGGSTSGNLGLGRLVVGDNGAGARVTLVNMYDNLNPGGIEALYLYGSGGMDGLEIKDNSLLILGNVPAYAWIDGEMVDLHSLFGPGDVILPFQDAGGFNGGWISVVGRLPGDTDGDWDVDTDDYDTLVATFGGGPDLRTDFNEDGAVDLLDFAIQRDNFGFSLSGAPEAMAPTTTPEPATLAFLTLGGLAILRRKRSR